MQLCYIDESGTSDIPGTTTHYVLAGLSVPDQYWGQHNEKIERIKSKYGLGNAEIHTAWMLRKYYEQGSIADFESLSRDRRRVEVQRKRNEEILRLQKVGKDRLKQTRKNYKKTEDYVHLTLAERQQIIVELAELIGGWGVVRLFAECIDKLYFEPSRRKETVQEQAFEQVVSRFEQYLQRNQPNYGLLIHDNNETVAERHTELMKTFLDKGTLWTGIKHVIETPMFVDSQLNSMVQLADLCAYAIRRYLENGEEKLFNLIFERADRLGSASVGVRHFTKSDCSCSICTNHSPKSLLPVVQSS